MAGMRKRPRLVRSRTMESSYGNKEGIGLYADAAVQCFPGANSKPSALDNLQFILELPGDQPMRPGTYSAFFSPHHAFLPPSAGHWTRNRSAKGRRIFPDRLSVFTRAQDSTNTVRSRSSSVAGWYARGFAPVTDDGEGDLDHLTKFRQKWPRRMSFAASITQTAVAGPLVRIRSG